MATRRSGKGTTREGAPDVRVELRGGGLILLECKWESSASLLDEQIAGRLAQFPEALGLLGVLYPERLQKVDDLQASLEAAGGLRWRFHGSRGSPSPLRSERAGTVADLVGHLRVLSLELGGTDRVDAGSRCDRLRHREGRRPRAATPADSQADREKHYQAVFDDSIDKLNALGILPS